MSPFVSYLGKAEARKIPFVGFLCDPLMQLLISRDVRAEKSERDLIVSQIEQRQIAAEQGELPPVVIFPEGATTNGTSVITFKRGAFNSLRAVKPYFSKTWSLTGIMPVHGDSISFISLMFIIFGCGIATYTLHEMPVFKPNDYFWTNHWDGKEEKWRLYARVMQQIIAETGGFELSLSTLEDKLEYRNLIRGSKNKKKQS